MDFALSAEARKYRDRYRAFVRGHLLAYDTTPESFDEHDNLRPDLLEDLRNQAKDEGLWAPQMPVARGGRGLATAESGGRRNLSCLSRGGDAGDGPCQEARGQKCYSPQVDRLTMNVMAA